MILQWVQNITMYRLMLYVLLLLLAAAALLGATGVLPYSAWDILYQSLAFAGMCWAVNFVFTRTSKIPSNPESSLITGLILSAIAGPLVLPQDWLVVLVMSTAAMASKYLLVLRRSHVFNPAAFGAVFSALVLGYPASWWVGSYSLLPITLLGGVLLMIKTRRWHLVFTFLFTYMALVALDSLVLQGRGMAEVMALMQTLLASSPLLFFSFVMLVEPLTAPQTQNRRLLFGVTIAFVLFFVQRFISFIPYSLELSLLAGNIFARAINPDFRQAFSLQRKVFNATSIGHFWFEPARHFTFKAGQFLEYTLPHTHSDSRGVRRYFSIASSPTEPQVLLAARFSEPGSTFKQNLKSMEIGDEIIASKVAGDFVLPADIRQKIAFIAGGIGITPFRSMVKYLLDTNQSRDIVLLYGARTPEDLAFSDVLEDAHKVFGMRTIPIISQLIDSSIIKTDIPDFAERVFYISGPEPMVQGLVRVLVKMGVPRSHIKKDYFPGYKG